MEEGSTTGIGRGAAILFVGSLVSMVLAFGARIVIARYWSEADYGVYSLSLVVLNMAALLAGLGLPQGVARSVAISRGKGDSAAATGDVGLSALLVVLFSFALAGLLFGLSGTIANGVFHEPSLTFPLKVFSLGLPLLVVLNLFSGLLRGFGDMRSTAWFRDGMKSVVFLAFVIPVAVTGLDFEGVFYAYLAALALSCTALLLYSAGRLPLRPGRLRLSPGDSGMNQLLWFSLPFVGIALLQQSVVWIDTLMVGGLRASIEVGWYSAAHPIAHFMSVPANALWLAYLPATALLYTRGDLRQMRSNLQVLTKWLCTVIWPVCLALLLFPDTVLTLFFGGEYAAGAYALRILAAGFALNACLALTSSSLVVLGRSQFVMMAGLTTVLLNIALNLLLIPRLGIEGAAIATAVSLTASSILRYARLRALLPFGPFRPNALKPLAVSTLLMIGLYLGLGDSVDSALWVLPVALFAYAVVYAIALLVTKSIDPVEAAMVGKILGRPRIGSDFLRRIADRFF